MIRILHVFMSMDCGGAENMIMNIYRNIDREKIQFDFLVHKNTKGYFDDEIKEMGGRIFRVPRFCLLNYFKYKKSIDTFFGEHKEFAAVHGHLGSSACVYLREAKKCIFTIAHSHSADFDFFQPKNFIYHELNRITRRVADYFFACSLDAGICRFGKKIKNKDNFQIIKNAINLDKYKYDDITKKEITNEFNLENKFVIGHVGRFDKQKNQAYAVEVFNEILKKNPDSVLMLVGDGKLRTVIENRVNELGIADKVIMTGIRSDVDKLLQVMDCFIFPSISEGLGIVAIEAEAYGIPCFINDTLPKDLYINENVYGLSLKKEPKEWAQFILEKSKEKISAEIAKRNVQKAGYDINESVKMLENFYLNIK